MITPSIKGKNIHTILGTGVVAVIRAQSSDQLVEVCEALLAGGVKAMEVTMTTPNALEVIHTVSHKMKGEALIGVGTVLDPETCRAAILAGAEFVVGPTLNVDVIRMCNRYNAVVIPGAYTPTEILAAWEAGADIVKVFPATSLGPAFFKDVLGPLPQVRMAPTGGVSLETVEGFIKAGACSVAVGGNLVSKNALANNDYAWITETAKQFVAKVKTARGE